MTLPSVEMKQILAVLVILAILPSGPKSSPIHSQARHSGLQSEVARGQQQAPYMVNQMQAMSNWLGRLHGLLTETALPPDMPAVTTSPSPTASTASPPPDVSTPKPNVIVHSLVQLAKQKPEHEWDARLNDHVDAWGEIEHSRLEVNTSNFTVGGVLVASYGGHLSQVRGTFRARFAVNEKAVDIVADESEDWGNFFANFFDFKGTFRPFCFCQMFRIPPKTDLAKIELQTKGYGLNMFGGGAMVAAFPPPASLSTAKVSFMRADTTKSFGPSRIIILPAGTKALLIMTFNGLVESPVRQSGGSLDFEVDGISVTAVHNTFEDSTEVHKFGFYKNPRYAVETEEAQFAGLTQLAVVDEGEHTIQVVAEGPEFDVKQATFQMMVIPTNSANMYSAVSDEWETITEAGKTVSLVTVELQTTLDNTILIIAASFNAHTPADCHTRHSCSYQINVDGERVYSSSRDGVSQFGAWHEEYGPTEEEARGLHGSMLVFAKIAEGLETHSIELIHRNTGQCRYITKGAILQVGVVPSNFTIDPIVSVIPVGTSNSSSLKPPFHPVLL